MVSGSCGIGWDDPFGPSVPVWERETWMFADPGDWSLWREDSNPLDICLWTYKELERQNTGGLLFGTPEAYFSAPSLRDENQLLSRPNREPGQVCFCALHFPLLSSVMLFFFSPLLTLLLLSRLVGASAFSSGPNQTSSWKRFQWTCTFEVLFPNNASRNTYKTAKSQARHQSPGFGNYFGRGKKKKPNFALYPHPVAWLTSLRRY